MAKAKRRKRRRRPAGAHQPPQPRPQTPAVEPVRRSAARDERPPAPWGSFPLQELTVLVGLALLVIGFLAAKPVAIAVGVVLGCLAGLELSVREHFAGYRSHTALLAGTAFVLTVAGLYYAGGLILLVCLAVGAVVFGLAVVALRGAFRRASGGLSFRVGGLRG